MRRTLKLEEDVAFARACWRHSVLLTALPGLLVRLQPYVLPWMVPALPSGHTDTRQPDGTELPQEIVS